MGFTTTLRCHCGSNLFLEASVRYKEVSFRLEAIGLVVPAPREGSRKYKR